MIRKIFEILTSGEYDNCIIFHENGRINRSLSNVDFELEDDHIFLNIPPVYYNGAIETLSAILDEENIPNESYKFQTRVCFDIFVKGGQA